MSEVIGGPFSQGVLDQIKVRQSNFKDNSRSTEQLQYFNSKSAWIRMISSVNVAGSNSLATSTVLMGGLEGYEGLNSYLYSADKGYRPMPGITSVEITSINRFGTLKEATVTFNCWSVEQLEDLDKLYMRPGFSVLLEWGNTCYIDNNKDFTTTIPSVKDFVLSPPKGSTEVSSRDLINKYIAERRVQSGYNYDALYGLIKNFSWKYRPDGGYDCTVVITSIGELLESFTIDVGMDVLGTGDSIEELKKAETPTVFDAIIKEIIEKAPEEVWSSLETLYPTFTKKYRSLAPNETTFYVNKYAVEGGVQKGYIRMDSFLNVINTILSCDKDKASIIKFFTNPKSTKTSTSFRTYDYHISSDPLVCILPTASTNKWRCGTEVFTFVDTLKNMDTEIKEDSILGIWLSTDLIQDAVKSYLGTANKQDRSVVKFLNSILGKVNEAIGDDYNALDLDYEEEESTFYIVDRNFRKKQTYPILTVTGTGTTVTDFDFTTKLSPKLGAMVAVSAQVNNTDAGVDVENMFEWNKGLTDKILGNKLINTTKNAENKSEIDDRIKQQQARYETISGAIRAFFVQGKYNKDVTAKAKNAYGDFTRDFIRYYREPTTDAGPKGIIPFEGSLTLDGIAGIKRNQIFRINEGVMPPRYNKSVGFIVTGIDHSIQNNRWQTKLKAQTIILNYSEAKSSFEEGFTCKEIPAIISDTLVGAPLLPSGTLGAVQGVFPSIIGPVEPNQEFWTLVAICATEASFGDSQGRADVAQSIYNRLGSGQYGGRTLTQVILQKGQYEPTWRWPRWGQENIPNQEWRVIRDIDSAAAATNLAPSTILQAARDITNPDYQDAARRFVQGRTDFLGANQPARAMTNNGSKVQRNTYGNKFGFSGNYRKNVVYPIPDVILAYKF